MGKIRVIERSGNISRFHNQKTARLIEAHAELVKEVSAELQTYTGYSFPRKGTCIVATFLGDKGVPFIEIRPYTAASLLSLKANVDKVFMLDTVITNYSTSPGKQETIPLPQEECVS